MSHKIRFPSCRVMGIECSDIRRRKTNVGNWTHSQGKRGKGGRGKVQDISGCALTKEKKGKKERKKEGKRKVFGYQRSLNPQRRRKRREKEGKRWVSVELEWSTKEKKGKIERKEQKWWVSVGLEPGLNLLYSPVSYWTCIYITCDADTNTSFSVLLHTALQTWSIWPESNKREQNHTTHTHTHTHTNNNTHNVCVKAPVLLQNNSHQTSFPEINDFFLHSALLQHIRHSKRRSKTVCTYTFRHMEPTTHANYWLYRILQAPNNNMYEQCWEN